MSGLILGVDGGGTKSHLAVFDESGKCTGVTSCGALNHEVMEGSYSELEDRLLELIPQVLRDASAAQPHDIAFAVFGMAGADTKEQVEIISDIVRKTGLERFIVCNDAYLGVPAGCPGGIGICAVNGTGFKLAAIDRSGYMLDTCGLGACTDDRGGGNWYGTRACAEVYNALFKLGKPTKMRPMLFDLFGISGKHDFSSMVAEPLSSGCSHLAGSAELNSIVFKAAAQGDAVALNILDESAAQYGGAIARLAMDLDFPCDELLHVTLAGSVFVKQKVSVLHDMVKRHVAEILGDREVEYHVLDTAPVAGAVVLAAQRAGFDFGLAAAKAELTDCK